jgi:hypothetical protein
MPATMSETSEETMEGSGAAEPGPERAPTAGGSSAPAASSGPVRLAGEGQPEKALPEWLGDRYRIGDRLGSGAFGVVYRARDERLGRTVAIKVLAASDPQALQRFRTEALTAAQLHHPNIVEVTDFAHLPDGRPFLVMEHVQGETLAARLLRRKRLSVAEAVRVAHTLAVALEAAHVRHVVHRDLKPSNVMLGAGPNDAPDVVKILDFGIAKLIENRPGSALTATGQILGTPAYMAPEQARNQAGVDRRADIYAIGVILYEALTGSLPFDAQHALDLLIAKVTEDPSPPSCRVSDVPRGLEVVVLKAICRDRDQRFARASELAQALEPFLDADSGAPLPPSGGLRGRFILAVEGLVLMVVAAATLGHWLATTRNAAPCVPAAGAVAWWDGEAMSGRKVRDRAGAHHGQLLGGAKIGKGLVGNAFAFDGTGEVQIPVESGFMPRSALTVEAWVKPGAFERPWQRLVSQQTDDQYDSSFILGLSAEGGLYFGLFHANWQTILAGKSPLALDQWNHVAGVWDGRRMSLFVNGRRQPETEAFSPPLHRTAQPLRIGKGNTLAYAFQGKIDEVTLYDRGLTAAELGAVWAAGRGGKCKDRRPR